MDFHGNSKVSHRAWAPDLGGFAMGHTVEEEVSSDEVGASKLTVAVKHDADDASARVSEGLR